MYPKLLGYSKMYASPSTLSEICLDAVSSNIVAYIQKQSTVSNSTYGWFEDFNLSDGDDDETAPTKKYKFRDSGLFLIREVSEQLLECLGKKSMMCNAILNIFIEANTKLQRVRLRDCRLTTAGFGVMEQHKIVELDCLNIKGISIPEMLGCLNMWSTLNMSSASFAKCTFVDGAHHRMMVTICQLKNLRSLNLAYTELNQQAFEMICEDLRLLEKLDITGTAVNDLQPLAKTAERLISFVMSDLPLVRNFPVVFQLSRLKHLDISLLHERVELNAYPTSPITLLLNEPHHHPELVSLEISGWRELNSQQLLLDYIQWHPQLVYLGIVVTVVCFQEAFADVNHPDYPANLQIAGLANEEHIRVALRKYKERSTYVQKALYHLFQLSSGFNQPQPDWFALIIPIMERHLMRFGVQMASTACLYNMTRGEFCRGFHPKTLQLAIEATLNAMSAFPKEFQLQKNALLTLCSDRILQDIQFDRYKCAKLVLDSLCFFDDVNLNRMAVAICSILASKVTTKETTLLGSRPEYMQKLLALVQTRTTSNSADITLKFTLSALWNLTDESAATCSVFLQQNGAHHFLKLLENFRNDHAIETKVLGLFNNIAEVPWLRQGLRVDSLMCELSRLLDSDNIDVSYFAAGIVAYLTRDGEEKWGFKCRDRREMLGQLEATVLGWKVPDTEMVAYRTFRPFYALLALELDAAVQLWAVWAIHHVCSKNPQRYCRMLQNESGHKYLHRLITRTRNCHPEIKRLSQNILDGVESKDYTLYD